MLPELKISPICIYCDNCRLICPENAIFKVAQEFYIDEWSCTLCRLCIPVCPVDCIKEETQKSN